jgi:hypothetical protein
MTKFAMDVSISQFKKINFVIFIDQNLSDASIENMTVFLGRQMVHELTYGDMVQGIEFIVGHYPEEEGSGDPGEEEAVKKDGVDKECYGEKITQIIKCVGSKSTSVEEVRLTRQVRYEGAFFDGNHSDVALPSCRKLYLDATVLKKKDIDQLRKVFPDLQKLTVEAQNIYQCKFNLKKMAKMCKLELIVTPSDSFPTLLCENHLLEDGEDKEGNCKFKIKVKEE